MLPQVSIYGIKAFRQNKEFLKLLYFLDHLEVSVYWIRVWR